MKLTKLIGGFLLGALGAFATLVLYSTYFGEDFDFLFIIVILPVGTLIGGIVGGLTARTVHWSKGAFTRLGVFALIGAFLIGGFYTLVPGNNVDTEILAIYYSRQIILRNLSFGLPIGGAIGAALGLFAVAIWGEDFFQRRRTTADVTSVEDDDVWPPAPERKTP